MGDCERWWGGADGAVGRRGAASRLGAGAWLVSTDLEIGRTCHGGDVPVAPTATQRPGQAYPARHRRPARRQPPMAGSLNQLAPCHGERCGMSTLASFVVAV